jgi:CRISPR-associated protein Cmr5
MNKETVDQWIPKAYEAIQAAEIPEADGKVKKGYRGQISAFGAAIKMGSVASAIAFFSKQGNSDYDRPKLLDAIAKTSGKRIQDASAEEIENAAIAIKLALNLYDWPED